MWIDRMAIGLIVVIVILVLVMIAERMFYWSQS